MGIFGNAFGWPHMLIILAVILLLFGAAKLPALAKSLGQSARVFKGEMKAMKEDGKDEAAVVDPTADASAVTDGTTDLTPPAAKSSDQPS